MKADQELIAILRRTGPQTGEQLLKQSCIDVFPLWQICKCSPEIHCEIVGKRFLRLDRAVAGYARLSPSIRREFQTYTVVGLKSQMEGIKAYAGRLEQEIKEISRDKLQLARESMDSSLEASLQGSELILKKACFIIAGDIVHEMSHSVPRPERSTGKIVRGSDLDIVVIADDDLPEEYITALDNAIYDKKYYLLVHPRYREEIDYLIKTMSRLLEQLEFDTFKSMVACKILWEGRFICGSASIFQRVKELIVRRNIAARLSALEEQAVENRALAEEHLLNLKADLFGNKYYNLFFTEEERLEDIF